ncbi:hypothetical protein AAY473_023041 [Plecturocebus cupreus]
MGEDSGANLETKSRIWVTWSLFLVLTWPGQGVRDSKDQDPLRCLPHGLLTWGNFSPSSFPWPQTRSQPCLGPCSRDAEEAGFQPVPFLPSRCQENLCLGRAVWHLRAPPDQPSSAAGAGWASPYARDAPAVPFTSWAEEYPKRLSPGTRPRAQPSSRSSPCLGLREATVSSDYPWEAMVGFCLTYPENADPFALDVYP